METSQIENFAQTLRNRLREGVEQRLLYWGFDEQGEVLEQPEPVEGGYMFRGEVFDDETVPKRWKQLKQMINLHGLDYVVEEGAYTWFNRLMAIRILEKNEYIQPQLQYEEGTQLPQLLQKARRGIFPEMKESERKHVEKQLHANKDNEAFARLLTHFCDTQPLISKVFGNISYSDDYTELLLPQNLLDREGILNFIVTTDAISDDVFEQVELIGWLYQYYISEKKDEVFKGFKKRKKAGPEELPAATQIFTPEWIVRYMVENTVGRLWLDLHPDSSVRKSFEYFVEPADENPKAEPIIDDVTDLTLLDPAAGSGHILVVGFEYLMKMYREEGYTARQAIEGILENNLYGLEIDERAAQLARFAVLLKAAKYDQSVLDGDRLPHIHAFPEKANISTTDIREFLGSEGEQYVDELKEALNILQEGKNFGSTIQLDISTEAIEFAKKRVKTLQPEAIENIVVRELLHKVEPFIQVVELLNKQYKAVAANPPYMGSRNMNGELKQYLKDNYPESKKDLFAVFIETMINNLQPSGYLGCITMEAWMFLSSYQKLREKILQNYSIQSLTHFGWHVIGIAFGTAMMNLKKEKPGEKCIGEYSYLRIEDIDDTENSPYQYPIKDNGRYSKREQSDFFKIPGMPIAYWVDNKEVKIFNRFRFISGVANSKKGLDTGENAYFLRYWYEVDHSKACLSNFDESAINDAKWFPYNKGGQYRKWYGNDEYVINWERNGEEIKSRLDWKSKKPYLRNKDFYFQESFSWSTVTSKDFSCRYSPKGALFDNGGSSLFCENKKSLKALAGLLNSNISRRYFEFLAPTLNYQPGDIGNIPVKKEVLEDEKIITLVETLIQISRNDWDRQETSWNFKNHELLNQSAGKLTESIDINKDKNLDAFKKTHVLEEKLNKKLIKIFNLSDIINTSVPLDKVTIMEDVLSNKLLKEIQNNGQGNIKEELKKEYNESEIIKSLLSYGIGCFNGRYRLDKEGLYIASSSHDKSELKYSVPYPLLDEQSTATERVEIDDDGLIPFIGSDGPFSDDVAYRMKDFIRIIWGEQSLTENLNYIQKKLDRDLEDFLVNKFWKYHTKLYSKRPIYWMFSSKKGAFKVLAYMHRMDKYTVNKVRHNYLHPYIDYLRSEIDKLENRGSLSSDQSKQQDKYRSNLEECLKYDEVIKEVADKQIEFDLDDGVKNNYKRFGDVLAKI